MPKMANYAIKDDMLITDYERLNDKFLIKILLNILKLKHGMVLRVLNEKDTQYML